MWVFWVVLNWRLATDHWRLLFRIQQQRKGENMARDRIGRGLALFAGIAYGAGMMYLLDPDTGRRRRALVRDKIMRARHEAQWWAGQQARNVMNNVRGRIAEVRARAREIEVPDERLERRVRAAIGHVTSHPGALEVIARDGHVTVRGPVFAGERERIEDRLSKTRGVRDCSLELREQAEAGSTPGLQGKPRRRRRAG